MHEVMHTCASMFIKLSANLRSIDHIHKERLYKDLMRWLSPLNFAQIQYEMSCRRGQGTGLWFLESSEFKEWSNRCPSTLWCPGIPGSGKTIIASLVVDHLTEAKGYNDNVGIAYVYCSYLDQYQQTAVNLVGAMLRQLLVKKIEKAGDISGEVLSIYQRHSQGRTRPLLRELTDLLVGQLAIYERTYLIIDALDECSEGNGARGMVIDLLRTLSKVGRRCSLLVTSRFSPSIERAFRSEECLVLQIRAENSDVQRFVQAQIETNWRTAQALKRKPHLQETIVEAVVEQAEGMFLLVKLQCSLLCSVPTLGELRESLNRLPQGLHEAYNAIFHRIRFSGILEFSWAQEILYWLTHAKRLLTIAELQCALSLELGNLEHDPEHSLSEEYMVDLCGSLITVERVTGVVHLVHYTAQEYLLGRHDMFRPDLPVCVALKCLSCLSLKDCREGPCASDSELEHRLRNVPLLEYAAKYWGDHMKDSRATETIGPAVTLLQDESLLASTWQIMHIPSARYPNYSQTYPQWTSGLQLAAFFDLDELVHSLVDCGMDIESQDNYYGRPLHAAAAGGSLNVCRLLLQKEVDVNARAGRFNSALQAATFAGHDEVVQFLLEAGADPNAQGGLYTTSLQAASFKGHLNIARMLLEQGAIVDAQISSGRTALHCAAMHGHRRIVKLLLGKGADVDSRDNDNGRTALSWAAWNGHSGTIDLLFARGADIDAVDHQNSTALHLALERHHEETVQDLLDKGAKVDVVDASNRTQIQIALASIEKINIEEFENDDDLTRTLDRGSQAAVSVLRRKPQHQLLKVSLIIFSLLLRAVLIVR